jgi:hypothetical protein
MREKRSSAGEGYEKRVDGMFREIRAEGWNYYHIYKLMERLMKTVSKGSLVILLSALVVCLISGNILAEDATPGQGKWHGSPSVSFTIEKSDNIRDFKISVPLAMGECNINISQIQIGKAGDIEFIHPKKYFSVKGKFKTSTSVEGTATIHICPDPDDKNNTVMLVPWEKGWKAELK